MQHEHEGVEDGAMPAGSVVAGFHLARINVPLNEAVAVFHLMGGGGGTHPPAQERVKWAAAGWQKGMLQNQMGY